MSRLILVRHSGLRQIERAEVRSALPPEAKDLDRDEISIDTLRLAEEVADGSWEGHDAILRQAAADVRALADAAPDPQLHYFGIAQIPHVIAIAAHLGDERFVHVHEFDRARNSWDWPESGQTLRVTSDNVPGGPPVTASGQAVLRVSISGVVADEHIRPHVGVERLADITIRPVDGVTPNLGIVRSMADLQAIREEVRKAIGAIRAFRPAVHTIHVFAAAPVSVCFVIGQELKPRNSPPVQTYRYRVHEGVPEYLPAILIRDGDTAAAERELSEAQRAQAQRDREGIWKEVLAQVVAYAEGLRARTAAGGRWYDPLLPGDPLALVAPFPPLKPFTAIDSAGHAINAEPFHGEYGYDRDHRAWRLGDGLLVGFRDAVGGDEQQLRDAIRLFFFHEYCHTFHGLTKYTADEVGKFANCLEYIDYTADTFALLHQLDLAQASRPEALDTDAKRRAFLADQIDLVLRSFWAFDPHPPVVEWQTRRLRRYLNWYWRNVQLRRSVSMAQALRLFRRQPHVELAGLHQFVRGRRVQVRLDRLDPATQLELAIVLEDDRLFRVQESPNASLGALLEAFMHGRHGEILQFFRTVFEGAEQVGGALPASDSPAGSL